MARGKLPAGHKGAAVEEAEIVLVTPRKAGPDGKRAEVEVESLPRTRLRVHGKVFTTGGQQMRIYGVTYGPFASNAAGEPFPSPARVRQDFAMMRTTGINSIRTYHLPPEWVMDLADEEGIGLLIDIPWRKH